MEKEKPIGVFDSGIGGLTVVKRLASFLPREDIIYFGDTARVPYGSKSNSTVIEYSLQAVKFLMNKNVKVIVVACNTASAIALNEIKKVFPGPVIGMIEPGAKLALKESKNKKIGVIGTRATVLNKAYSNELKRRYAEAEIIEQACPLFVPLAEEGWINHKATFLVAEEYLAPLKRFDIDSLILGCTHYPILVEVIRSVMGESVKLIDSGVASAEAVKIELDRTSLHSNKVSGGNMEFYVSDIPTKFKEVAELFLGNEIKFVSKVDLDSLLV